MRRALCFALAALLLLSCSSLAPAPISAGDICFRCSRVITNVKFAGEVIDPGGFVFKFRTVGCPSKYLADHPTQPKAVFVTDLASGKLVRAEAATFVRTVIDENTNERDYAAFRLVSDAASFAREKSAEAIDWHSVVARAGAGQTAG